MRSRIPCLLVLAISLASLALGQGFLLRHGVPRVISDGYGYWSYLPAVVVQGDPSFRAYLERHEGTPLAQGLLRAESGAVFQKYPVGVALLELPFFLAAHAWAALAGLPRDGWSGPYQLAAAAGAGFYALAGLALLMAGLRGRYPPGGLALAGLFVFLGTNAYHYATYDGSFSHIHSFFLGAALTYFLFRGKPGIRSRAVPAGLVLGLLVLVRQTNALYFLLVAGWIAGEHLRASGRPGLRRAAAELAVVALLTALCFTLQMAAWRASAGAWFVYPYTGEYFEFASPHLLEALFGVRKGLFFWNPLYLAALAGLVLVRRPAGWLIPAALFLAAHAYVSASWYCWWYGGTLGQRVFVDVLPVLFPGLANLTRLASRPARWAVLALCALFTLHALWCTWFYWLGVIPPDLAGLEHLHLAWRHTRGWLGL